METRTAIDIASLAEHPAVRRARQILYDTDAETLADQLELVQIPAPPFHEAARAQRMRERFSALGLVDVSVDEVGNVLARLPANGASSHAPLLVAAHLDTIFPEGTDITVRREGGRLFAPGISDNARGLAATLALARALLRAGISTTHPVVFVATVGEEGIGDLRGVKHLFRDDSPWRAAAGFLSLDGAGRRRIVHRAVGSRRFRITFDGPGGHSWADWGIANPIHALGLAISEFVRITPPFQPRSALTVARVAGGTSVNAIPERAWLELDLRSEDPRTLAELEARVRRALNAVIQDVNARRRIGTPALTASIDVIGDRPAGETPIDSPLVQAARAATHALGDVPELVASSTDANIPIALGIPAITLGAGGESGGTHTTEEWYSNHGGPEGIERALLTLLAVAGVADR